VAGTSCQPEYVDSLKTCFVPVTRLKIVSVRVLGKHASAEQKQLSWYAGEKDLRELSPEEDKLLRKASSNKDGVAVADLPEPVIQSLYKRHLVYINVPVSGHQHFSTSSLEGFVSNRDMVAGDADPMESLLYEVFVSNSERLSVDALAQVLGRPAAQIQDAISTACRLGFAQLINSDGAILGGAATRHPAWL